MCKALRNVIRPRMPAVPESGGGYNEGDEDGDSLEYEDDENARLLDVCIDGDVEDLGSVRQSLP